ncbi:MAG TPA: hypothetical protein P5571_12850 [Candidatus Krumholzibacteria bacterium]|nr:hypothetical protein [Candidatus Krumholzibacteria bacterium]HRX52250.1 hypothetical protein [Candidatus Krumholzibacteria bacterium]
MRPNKTLILTAAVLMLAVAAMATTTPSGVVVNERIWNDCPTSTITSTVGAGSVNLVEQKQFCGAGWGSRHNWRFSDGVSALQFANGDGFRFSADITLSGTGEAEAGLSIAPWWSPNVDGVFNLRTTDGEIACFGGRLPFYSFTSSQGITYTKGETVHCQITYLPNMLSPTNPGTIEYVIVMGGTTYSSGVLNFGEGNPAEPYGLWGILDDAQAGANMLHFLQQGEVDGYMEFDFQNITFEDLGTVANEEMTFGQVKALFR